MRLPQSRMKLIRTITAVVGRLEMDRFLMDSEFCRSCLLHIKTHARMLGEHHHKYGNNLGEKTGKKGKRDAHSREDS